MTILAPLSWPDPRLSAVSEPVTRFDAPLKALAQDVLESMRAAPGVGATAAHFGVLQRLFVLELPEDGAPQTFVNARIIGSSLEQAEHPEGSISMRGASAIVSRPARVQMRWQDLDGVEHEAWFEGFRAACVQHEIDQMDGIFWLQRLSKLKRDRLITRWRKQTR